MKRHLILVVIGLALVLLGQLAGRDGAWAAPGQSPKRQSYPSMTPTPVPGSATDTPVPPTAAPTMPPPPPTDTPAPTTPTATFAASTFTPTWPPPTETSPADIVAATPIPSEPPLSAGDGDPTGIALPPSATPRSVEEREVDTPSPTEAPVVAPLASPTAAELEDEPAAAPAATATPAVAASSPTPQSQGLIEAMRQEWLLICGLGLLLLALLLFIMGYLLGRRGQD